ncbi:unnamed protein product [Durusdinium trenchii]|uniref:Uncharacterized protein n=1 Tax=Durusdinium trenchii TaxID=1381693 RepID=A0ABP0PSZ3_9DINO
MQLKGIHKAQMMAVKESMCSQVSSGPCRPEGRTLRARSHEVPGQESWRRDVDNSQLWKVFGLHTAAGRNLKKLYQPPLSVPLPGRSRSRLGDSDKENFQNTWSSPFLATRAGGSSG